MGNLSAMGKWKEPRGFDQSLSSDLKVSNTDRQYGWRTGDKLPSVKRLKEMFKTMVESIPHHTDNRNLSVTCPYCGNDVMEKPLLYCPSCGRNDFTLITNDNGRRVLITKQKG